MASLRILQIIRSEIIGGAETMLLDLLGGLDATEFRAGLCIIGSSPLANEAKVRGFETKEIRPYTGKRDVRFLLNLARTIRRTNPHIVHSHIWFTNLYASVCGGMLGIPVISTFHSNYSIDNFWERASLRVIYHFSSRTVLVSNYQVGHLGFKPRMRRTCVIRNGVTLPPLKTITPLGLSELKKTEIGVKNRDKIITYVSNLRPIKGHIYLLQAMRLVLREFENVSLLLIGDGPLRQELTQFCEEYGLSHRVKFLGFRNDIMDLLSLTDIFVHPSLSEANSMAVMEAMANAKAVIATNVGGN